MNSKDTAESLNNSSYNIQWKKKCKPQKYRKVLSINGEKGIIYSLV